MLSYSAETESPPDETTRLMRHGLDAATLNKESSGYYRPDDGRGARQLAAYRVQRVAAVDVRVIDGVM